MFENLRRDLPKYTFYGHGRWYINSGFWIVAIYRFGMWTDSLPSKVLQIPLWILYLLLKQLFRNNHVLLWAGRGTRIGPGLRLIHPINVLIGQHVEIGEDCLIFNDVTLGSGQEMPKIGNNVTIYPGARVLGRVVIGDNAVIGANCVVMKDIPSNSVLLAAPGRVIPRSLSPVARKADQRSTKRGQILG
jgi:serine O-acetyltransferase